MVSGKVWEAAYGGLRGSFFMGSVRCVLVFPITSCPVTVEELLNTVQPELDDMREMLDREMLVQKGG